ncbi:MAG: hypothetical protein ACK55Z_14315, partial [bacterium]
GQIKLEEASVSLGESSVWLIRVQFYDFYFLNLAVASSQPFEAFNWNFAAPCDELNELCSLTVVQLFQDFP